MRWSVLAHASSITFVSTRRAAVMKRRKPRDYRRGRIEIIPMIDVMFFLLATFMLSSLSMQNLDSLQVNLPEGQAEKLSAKTPVTLTLTSDSKIYINRTHVTLET